MFWPDDISLSDAGRVHAERLSSQSQVTDSYLLALALALAHGGRLASLDRRLVVDAVVDGGATLALI